MQGYTKFFLTCVHCRGEIAVFGLDNLDTSECEYPYQMRRMIIKDEPEPGFNEETYANDLAVVTLDAPVTFMDEVRS